MALSQDQIRGIVSDMTDAGFNEAEIDDTLRAQGVSMPEQPRLVTGLTTREAMQTGGAMLGAVGGAAGARSIFENKIMPAIEGMDFTRLGKVAKTVAPYLRIPFTAAGEGVGAGAGFAGGQTADYLTGGQKPDLQQALNVGATTALYGGIGEAVPAALGQGGLAAGGVSQEARGQLRAQPAYKPAALGSRRAIPPNQELSIGQRLDALARPQGITPGRIATEDLLKDVESKGARVDIRPTLDAFDSKIQELSNGLSPQEASAARVLQRMRDRLVQVHLQAGQAVRGDVSPTQMDTIAQSLDKVANFGKPGPTMTENAARDIYRAHKDSLYNQIGGLSEMAAATKARLDAIETMRNFINENKPQGAVASIGKGLTQSGHIESQAAIQALDTLEQELGTGGKIKETIRKAALGRVLTAEERPYLGFWQRLVERLGARPAGKFFMSLAKPSGSASAAVGAFQSAMQQGAQKPERNP